MFDEEAIHEIGSKLQQLGYIGGIESSTEPDPNLEAQLEAEVEIAEIHADESVAIAEVFAEAQEAEAEAEIAVAEAEVEAAEVLAEALEAVVETVVEETEEEDPVTPEDVALVEAAATPDVVEDTPPAKGHWFTRAMR